MRFEFRSNVGVCLLLVAGCLLAPRSGYADKLMYLAFTGQGIADAELFVVEVTEVEGVITAGVPARLNGPLVEGGSVRIGVPLADALGDAIYLATQDDADVLELYRVSTDTPGVSTKLNPPIDKAVEAIENLRSDFFAGGAVSRGKVFYTLRTLATGTLDLYVVDLDFPGVATQVNPDFGDGSEVKAFVVTPDGNNVVYAARLNSDADELFITSFASPGVATKLDGPPIGDDVAIEKLEVSPDGDKVGYVLDPTVVEQTGDLYVVDLDNPGSPKQVNADFAPGGLVIEWDFSPDSSQIAYRGTDSGMTAGRIYTVEVDDPGNATQISPEPAESAVGFFGVGVFMAYVDNGATLVYTSPLDHPDAPELYATSVLAPMTATKLSAPLAEMNPAPNGLVSAFVLNHNGMRMVYGEGLGGTSLVHVVDRVTPGVSVQPFGLAADQVFPFPFAIFSHESNLVASLVASSDPATGLPGGLELMAAISGVAGSGIIVSAPLAAGLGVGPFSWIPETPLTHVLTITDEGVDATRLQVWAGERIEIVNSSSRPHRIQSNPHPIHADCAPLNQPGQLEPGERGFTDAFTEEGTCGFHDHLNPSVSTFQGEVLVGSAQGGSGDNSGGDSGGSNPYAVLGR